MQKHTRCVCVCLCVWVGGGVGWLGVGVAYGDLSCPDTGCPVLDFGR